MLEVLIIGAGPTGLYAAFLAGLRKLNAAVIESGTEPGGQLTAVYKDKYIYDIPGFHKVKAFDYIQEQMKQFNRFKEVIPIHYENEAMDIIKEEDHFKVVTNKTTFLTKTVLIAHGGGGFVPQKLKIDKEFDNILYFVKDLNIFKDKNVLVLGGGDSALDWALAISEQTKHVTLSHRRDEFRALPTTVDEFRQKGQVLTPYVLSDVLGENNTANKVILKHAKTQEELTVLCDYIVVNYGFLLTKSKLEAWGIEGEKGLINVDYHMETNIKGIFAAGNGNNYPGKVKLISTGQGEAATAIHTIADMLYPDRNKSFEHSSSLIND